MRLLFGALALLAAALFSPGLTTGPSLDAAIFAGVADQMLDGDALYVDAWDHKPPAAYVVLAAGQGALPWLSPWLVSWVITILATAGAGVGIASALTALGVRRWAAQVAAGAAVAFMAQYLTALGGGLTEPLAALPAAGALSLVLRPLTARRLAAVGMLLGLALLVSIQAMPALFSVAGLGVLSSVGRERWRALLAIAAGTLLPWGAAGLALFAAGSLGAALDAVFAYGAAYRGSSAAYGAELSRAPAAWAFLSSLILVVPAGLGGLALGRARPVWRLVLYGTVGWIALAIASFIFQGRFIAHYAIPLAIPLGILAGVGLDAAAARWDRAPTGARAALALAFALTIVASLLAGLGGGRYEFDANAARGEQVTAAAVDVRQFSQPEDEILVWGNQAELYLAAERRPAIPYRFMYPLTTPGYVDAELIQQVLSDLETDPPALVVDAGSTEPGSPGFLPLLIDRPVAPEGREVDMLQPLRDFIRANYELVTETHGWPIYRLRTAESTGNR